MAIPLIIRPGKHADVEAIHQIYCHYVREGIATFEEDLPAIEEVERRLSFLVSRGVPFLVAEGEHGNVAGFAYAGPFKERSAYRFTVEDSIYLDPGACGRGIGSCLLARLIEECKAASFRQMIAVIGGGAENAGSIRVHARAGFRHVGDLKAVGFKFGRWLDVTYMQREL